MKKALGYALVGVVVFGGVLAALRVDRWLAAKPADTLEFLESRAPVRPVGLEDSQAPADFRAAARRLVPSVVSVDRLERFRNFFTDEVSIRPTGSGSGVILAANGTIVTNYHVVQNADQVQVRLADGRNLTANIIGTDSRSDLAVLKINAVDLTPIELGDSSKLEIGEWVIAVGSPLGFDETVSVGVVSSLNRTLETGGSGLLADAIQTDAAINFGNSGGALANAKGQLIGINTAIASETGGSVGLGFAIPVNRVQRVTADILKYGRVRYGSLGASFYNRPGLLLRQDAREQMKEATGAEPPKAGVIVRAVGRGTGAQSAGLGQLDVILEVDGRKVEEYVDLAKALLDKRAGDSVKVRFWSKGSVKTASIVLEEPA